LSGLAGWLERGLWLVAGSSFEGGCKSFAAAFGLDRRPGRAIGRLRALGDSRHGGRRERWGLGFRHGTSQTCGRPSTVAVVTAADWMQKAVQRIWSGTAFHSRIDRCRWARGTRRWRKAPAFQASLHHFVVVVVVLFSLFSPMTAACHKAHVFFASSNASMPISSSRPPRIWGTWPLSATFSAGNSLFCLSSELLAVISLGK
ncbi:hypothetical protein KCU93_g273, partial [Aureobasidium melanogenum]